MWRLYRESSVFVFPSEREGSPTVVQEAMSAGLAVVAADAAGTPEVVGDAGILVSPKDPAGIADALVRLANDPALVLELSARARERVRDGVRLADAGAAVRGPVRRGGGAPAEGPSMTVSQEQHPGQVDQLGQAGAAAAVEPAEATTEKKGSGRLGPAIKLGITFAITGYVVWQAGLSDALQTLASADWRLVGLAAVSAVIAMVINVKRWQVMLKGQGDDAGLGTLIRLYLVAMFFNNILPSRFAGDVVRAYGTSVQRDHQDALGGGGHHGSAGRGDLGAAARGDRDGGQPVGDPVAVEPDAGGGADRGADGHRAAGGAVAAPGNRCASCSASSSGCRCWASGSASG